MPLYVALYDIVNGGDPAGFRCTECGKVVKSKFGILMHLRFKHEIRATCAMKQEELPYEKVTEKNDKSSSR